MISFPNAKINIGLNVVSKREDGYHNLETIFYPVNLSDALEITNSKQIQFSLSGLKIDGFYEENLVFKAYKLLKDDYNLPPLKIHLHKVIPFGAGLGGGSSDGAFALKMLNTFFELNIPHIKLKEYASGMGADCPFFIDNIPAFASGTGDQLTAIDLNLSDYTILIVKPRISVNTADAYRQIKPQEPTFSLKEICTIPIEEWKFRIKNDFEKSVFNKHSEVKDLKNTLYKMGAVYASMSGSGSAVFGIFRHLPVNPDRYFPKDIFIYR